MLETEATYQDGNYDPDEDQDGSDDDSNGDAPDQDESGDTFGNGDAEDSGSGDDSAEDDATAGGASALAGASGHEVAAHRNMLGDVMQNLSGSGIDVEALAERAGIDSADVDALSHDDLATLTQYVTQHHPDVVQEAAGRFPAAQGLLGMLSGGGFGKFFGR